MPGNAPPGRLEFGRVGGRVRPHPVHAQPHRRVRVVGLEYGLEGPGTVAAQHVDEPPRVRRTDCQVTVDGREHRLVLALESPQHGVHEAARPIVPQHARGAHRFGDRRMRGDLARNQLEQANLEQRPQFRRHLLEWPLAEAAQDLHQAEMPAQRPVAK